MGPRSVHEFQKLVRNYLFCWTLAGINQPLSGWCQLRASVMQRGYFKHCLTPSTSQFSPTSAPPHPTLPSTNSSVIFFFHHDSALKVRAYKESNGTCLLPEVRHCLPGDLPSSHMIPNRLVWDSWQFITASASCLPLSFPES